MNPAAFPHPRRLRAVSSSLALRAGPSPAGGTSCTDAYGYFPSPQGRVLAREGEGVGTALRDNHSSRSGRSSSRSTVSRTVH